MMMTTMTVTDDNDVFPMNAAEWLDTDLDGLGDNEDDDDDGDGCDHDEVQLLNRF